MPERDTPEPKVLVVQTLGRSPWIRIITYDEDAGKFVRDDVRQFGVLIEDRAISSSSNSLGSRVDAFFDSLRRAIFGGDGDDEASGRPRVTRDVFHLQIDERYDQIAVEAWIRQQAERMLKERKRERAERAQERRERAAAERS